jgi:hypothetical protein
LEEGGDGRFLQLVTGLFVIVHHMTAEIATGVTAYLPTDRDLGVIIEIFSGTPGVEQEPDAT